MNNSARGMMAAAAKYRNDQSGQLNTGGSSTAFTITSSQVYTALTDGITIVARLHAANGAAPTLNVDSLGAKAIRTHTSTAVSSGVMNSGGIYKFTYDSGDDCWYVNDFFTTSTTTFSDAAFRVQDNSDATKQLAFELSGVTTATTRTVTIPDSSGTLAYAGNVLAIANNLSDVASAETAFTNIKQAASDTAQGVLEIAVQSEMETATDVLRAVVPGRQRFHPAHPKAWANINQSGTQAINQSSGVSSITDQGVGTTDYTFSTAFSATTYGWNGTMGDTATTGDGAGVHFRYGGTKTTTVLPSMRSGTWDGGTFANVLDSTDANMVAYGDQ